jgi:hypothetical protein
MSRVIINRLGIAAALVMAAISAASAPNDSSGAGQKFGARVIFANAPGGDYIQCDPRNPSSPIRCKADGW